MNNNTKFKKINKIFFNISELDKKILALIPLIIKAAGKVRSINIYVAFLEDGIKITVDDMKKPLDRKSIKCTEDDKRFEIKYACLNLLIKLFNAGVLKHKDESFDREGKCCYTEYTIFYFSENLDKVECFEEYVSTLIDSRNKYRFMPILREIDSEEGEITLER
jgi:hypothetical protein